MHYQLDKVRSCLKFISTKRAIQLSTAPIGLILCTDKIL